MKTALWHPHDNFSPNQPFHNALDLFPIHDERWQVGHHDGVDPARGPGQEGPRVRDGGDERARQHPAEVDGADPPGAVHDLEGNPEQNLHDAIAENVRPTTMHKEVGEKTPGLITPEKTREELSLDQRRNQ